MLSVSVSAGIYGIYSIYRHILNGCRHGDAGAIPSGRVAFLAKNQPVIPAYRALFFSEFSAFCRPLLALYRLVERHLQARRPFPLPWG